MSRKMTPLIINTRDYTGGAARAAYRLHTGLKRIGHDSKIYAMQKDSFDETVYQFEKIKIPKDLKSRLTRYIHNRRITKSLEKYKASRLTGCELFSDCRTCYGASVIEQLPLSEVINLHWIAGFIDYKSFFTNIAGSIPIVWTLHDMNPFTGGCHYDNNCKKYMNGCGRCPQLDSNDKNDLSMDIWQRKKEIFEKLAPSHLHIVTPSKWLAELASNSPLLKKFDVSVIPNGIDIDKLAPRNKKFARSIIGIPENARVVLFVAHSLTEKRKGFSFMAQAMKLAARKIKNLFLLSLGNSHVMFDSSVPRLHLGYISQERILSMIYSAADIFLISSIQDNLPNTVLESMACGTPVLGFNVGGIPEMVTVGKTGILVDSGDINALSEAVSKALNTPSLLTEMSYKSRQVAEQNFNLLIQAQRYQKIYQQQLTPTNRAINSRRHS